MLRLPRKWVMVAGLLAAVPSVTLAGPFDFLKPQPKPVVAAQSERTNQQLADQVAGALRDAKLKGFDINIEVKQGVATLNGKISDPQQKALATKAASQIDGIVSVDNQLQLATPPQNSPVTQAGYQGNDGASQSVQQVQHQQASRGNQQVAQQIADSLVAAGLGESGIEVRFKDGACSLIGDLNSPQQAAAAYQITGQVPGVREVLTQKLTVGGREFQPQSVRPVAHDQYAMQQYMQQPPGYPQMPPMAGPPMGAPPQVQQAGFPGQGYPGHGAHFGSLNPHEVYNSPNLPEYAWPAQAAYDNYAAVTYPSQYDASAWPYIGPFYPYPQVPLGWRSAQLVWDDGYWNLKFNSRTDKWWWFLHPKNWD